MYLPYFASLGCLNLGILTTCSNRHLVAERLWRILSLSDLLDRGANSARNLGIDSRGVKNSPVPRHLIGQQALDPCVKLVLSSFRQAPYRVVTKERL